MASRVNGYSVAVVGATGAVGREFLRIAEGRDFPIKALRLLASARSAGSRMSFRGEELPVEETVDSSFRGVDLAFISATTEASRHYAPLAVAAGAVAIDDSSAFRMDPSVPLVVPEVPNLRSAGQPLSPPVRRRGYIRRPAVFGVRPACHLETPR